MGGDVSDDRGAPDYDLPDDSDLLVDISTMTSVRRQNALASEEFSRREDASAAHLAEVVSSGVSDGGEMGMSGSEGSQSGLDEGDDWGLFGGRRGAIAGEDRGGRGASFRPLTRAEEENADQLLSRRGHVDEQMVDDGFTGIVIKRSDMRKLRPGEWLNDEVVNLYMGLLQQRNTRRMDRGEGRMHFFNTFFYEKLAGGDAGYSYDAVQRWTRSAAEVRVGYSLLDCAKIMCPINHGNAHWTHAVINLRDRRFEFYDSMAGGAGVAVLRHLSHYISDLFRDKRIELDTTGWEMVIFTGREIPQQLNGFDCGMFSCKFADFVSRDAPISFTQGDMPYFRSRTALEIAALLAE